jgi:hypothetical protein
MASIHACMHTCAHPRPRPRPQACEFDYSGTQACKSLRQEGYRVVLLNSNPVSARPFFETRRPELLPWPGVQAFRAAPR